MKVGWLLFAAASMWLVEASSHAEIKIAAEYSSGDSGFAFPSVPPPTTNDAASRAQFTLVDGLRDRNGGSLDVLHDGGVPSGEDQPRANFFFAAGTAGGRLRIDLDKVISVKQVGSYSWHAAQRGPQVYQLYAADGTEDGFELAPPKGVDLETSGWKCIARVDTRPKDGDGQGQHGVAITDTAGPIGRFRYLLFEIATTGRGGPFGNTFYSEIDVIDADGPAPAPIAREQRVAILKSFEAEDGKYHFTIDATQAPDLADWSEKQLQPVIRQWYPKIVALLPGEGYQAPTDVALRFRSDMGGTPASAGGARVNLNAAWFRGELNREALGAVVHELVHVVQGYGNRRRNGDASPAPSWVVEGIADYIRWFLYEPQTKGAEITRRNLARARYDSSYRVTGNFLNYLVQEHDPQIVHKLNLAAREARYGEQLWQQWTGHTVQELGDQWKQFHQQRLDGGQGAADNNATSQ